MSPRRRRCVSISSARPAILLVDPGRADDRLRADRRPGRGGLFRRLAGGDRRTARRDGGGGRTGAGPHADARADRRLRPQSRRVPDPATARARPLRSGHAGPDREPARARRAGFPAAAPGLRRRRRGPPRHDRRNQAARTETGPGVRRPARRAGDSRRLRHRRARPDLAGRAQQPGAAARAGQRSLCGDVRRGREAGRGQALCLGPAPVGELADQKPRTARAHDPQRGERDRSPAGRLSRRGRVGLKAAQLEDGRRGDRRARVDGLARHRAQVHPDPARVCSR